MTRSAQVRAPLRLAFTGAAAAVVALVATVVSAGVGFNAPVKYPVGGSPNLRVVSDFNNDGKPDLASSDSTGNTVEVLMNDGNGNFTAASYAVGNQPTNVVSCDTNGDGLRDLIVGNKGSSSFSVLVNQGGAFLRLPCTTRLVRPHNLLLARAMRLIPVIISASLRQPEI